MVGEADDPLGNRDVQRNLHQGSAFQVPGYEILDDAADSQADPGKFDQKLHVGGHQKLVDLDLVLRQIGVHMLAAHVALI